MYGNAIMKLIEFYNCDTLIKIEIQKKKKKKNRVLLAHRDMETNGKE
jgi:hypothetical protein